MKVKSYIHFYIYKNKNEYGFAWIANAFGIIYTFTFLYPIILSYILKAVGSGKPIDEVICVFDYSIIMYIPATFLAILPYKVISKIFHNTLDA